MNGNIDVESAPGVGSVFTVRLPQKKEDCEILGKDVAENLAQFRTGSRAQMKRARLKREPMPYGSVLIVDDVETNIYVAKGLLAPYGLKIDSADSGFAAIDKIKSGREYDIIFMDHMMPEMDGIEAVKIIRELGYTPPIVALTANAVAGQADIFLGNGFDDFISKPIDIRRMNLVLNKLIRDKQTPEVIEKARQNAKKSAPAEAPVNEQIIGIFLRDAAKALAALEEISEKNNYNDKDDLRTYIINVHGIKTALANIGKPELSAVALKLEAAAREDRPNILLNETPAFLKSLRTLMAKLTPESEDEAENLSNEDEEFLREKLLLIKNACENYDESAAEKALEELRTKTWTHQVNTLLSEIAEHLLHSDFEEAFKKAENGMN